MQQAGQKIEIEAFPVRVAKVAQEADDILSFEFVDPDNGTLPPFSAGCHVDVTIREGLKRQYSLCNDPSERNRYLVAVLKEIQGRGGSAAMHDVKPGDILTITSPRNRFPLAGPEASSHLLLAGGIGVTPMMAMLDELGARGADFRMHYCTRAPEKTAFLDRLEPLIAYGKVVLHYDGGDPANGLDIAGTLSGYQPGMHVYYCGPPGFMSAAREASGAWPPHTVHCEYFTAAESSELLVNEPFKVRIKNTSVVLDVGSDQTIVEALRANGVTVDTDCTEGYCGTCITRYVCGEPEHRDTVLSEVERRNYVMICCARAKSPVLTLDL